MDEEDKLYQPSNGTEGMYFVEKFCMNCIHEKFIHTHDDNDAKCDIFSNSLLYTIKEPGYPREWTYDENGKPTCTAFKKWDWGIDDGEGGGLNEPPPPDPYDPNQLTLPFIINDEILLNHKQKENA